ncbi:hypothetical protein I3843_05G088800 [Carya illinoinensis]|uniref:Uncharacterized protein n=1 Tax=Carya illinoinensis TaxID=32201 RepID=A0A922EY29_CARIL|nr:hypothetical protein I3760_05G099400 [Carya illinoinensis]KAG6712273.1 hypothetical protein I3842_05G095500 [Carya illinoinensis]KAG7978573.1 hypothetical protein I3843_05G088800 [Carya illinoinensis]
MEDSKWVIDVNDGVKKMEDTSKEQWEKHSIYEVPACVKDQNKNAYRPQTVSFGPYHHGEAHLKRMEEHKHRALLHFLRRCQKPVESCLKALAKVVQDLKDSYEPLDPKWADDTAGFLKMMTLDGCFMLEILRASVDEVNDYDSKDPIFSKHGKLYIMPHIRRDMLMLENQIPMQVLELLLELLPGDKKKERANELIRKSWFPDTNHSEMGNCLHVLDVCRKILLQPKGNQKKQGGRPLGKDKPSGDEFIRSATELNEAGIQFKVKKKGSLKDITFDGGVLELPLIVVDDATESMFLNLIAFERFHVEAGNEITSYVFIMDNIIDNAMDVALLHSSGIIQNAIGSDKAVAKLFNSLSKDITLDPESSLDVVQKNVSEYCKQPWNNWRANLIHTYFRNPWAIISLIAAIFLFALTIVQTVYTILGVIDSPQPSHYYKPPLPDLKTPRH